MVETISTAAAPAEAGTRAEKWMRAAWRKWDEQKGLATVAGWSLLAAVVARGANLMALAICARILGQVEFGQVAVIQSTVGMFAPLASLGLALTTTKFVADYRDRSPERAGRILALSLCAGAVAGLAMTGLLIVLAPVLAAKGFADPGLQRQLAESSGLLFLGVIEAVQSGALTGLEAYTKIAKLSAWGGVLSIPVTAVLASQYGTSGAIAGLTVSLLLSCLLNGWMLRGECRARGIAISLRGCASERGVLFSFSLPAYVSGIVVAPVSWVGTVLLVQQANGFAEMAMYSAADRFRFVLIFIPLAVSRILIPALSRYRAEANDRAYRSAFYWSLGFSLVATVPAAVVCVALSPWLLSLFGKAYERGWLVLAILAISAIPTVLNMQLGAALLSNGKAWARTGVDGLLAVMFLAAAWLLVPRYQAAGLAGAFLVAYSTASIVLWFCLDRKEARVAA
jgi:O-antigen/teichoic acid export membrane protein